MTTVPLDDLDFPGQHWRAFAPERTKALGVHPNQLWFNESKQAGALVVVKPQAYEEYAVSKAGLEYVDAAHRGQRITGYVVLATRHKGKLAVVAAKCVSEVATVLEHVPPREGPFGLYWWLRNDLTPDGVLLGVEDEVPF